ncbi:MAG: hypothetical protein ACOYMF_16080, partial [Bacteroidales bacterium]
TAPAFALTGGSPTGGVYSGPGVAGGTFTPATAGVGTHTITYTFTDGNGCSNFCTFTIQVVSGSVTQTVNYNTGWNWISFNVLPVTPTVNNTLAGFVPQSGDVLKNQTQTMIYSGTVWNPNLTIDPDKAYLLKTAKPAGSFVVTNTAGNYVMANDPITINAAGWTWIGYKPRVQLTAAAAFVSMAGTFTNQDLVKNQTSQAVYFSATNLWQPGTFRLNPGSGYKLKYQRTPGNTLTYPPSDGSAAAPIFSTTPKAVAGDPGWAITPGMETNMSVYVTSATLAGVPLLHGKVAAFHTLTNQCRALEEFFDDGNGVGQVILTVGFNSPEAGNTFYYKVWNSDNDVVYEVNETGVMVSDDFQMVDLTLIPQVIATNINGTVTDEATSLPIAGVQVSASSGTPPTYGPPDWAITPGMETNMSVYVTSATLAGVPVLNGKVAAFHTLTNQCRALEDFFDDGNGVGQVILTVGFNSSEANNTFYYKVWNSDNNIIYNVNQTGVMVSDDFQMVDLTLVGAPAPVVITTTTGADGKYIFDNIADGTYTVCTGNSIPTVGYIDECAPGTVTTPPSAVVNFALTPVITCEDVVISNFPAAPANVCVGTAVSIDFTNVVAENAASVWLDSSPVEAGGWANSVFVLNTNYVGVVTITYTGYATPPCLDATETLSFEVYPLPVVTCPNDFAVCINDQPWEIWGMSPAGGTFTGDGVVDGVNYDPALAGVGVHEITYTYTDVETGCSNSCSFNITVNPLPVFECPAYGPFCEGDDAVVFEGVGVYTNVDFVTVTGFDPIAAGNYTFYYTVTELGCSASCEFTIVVNPLPVFECPAYGPFCAGDDAIVFGGVGVYTFEGAVVTGFDPAEAGSYLFVYTVTENGCSASCEFTIVVNPLPVFECPAYGPFCAGDDAVALTGEGVYTYNDQVLVEFAPVTAGEYLLVYTETTEFGCEASCEFTIVVNPTPEAFAPDYGSVCEGSDYIAFSGPVGYVYSYTGEPVQGFDPVAAGTYNFVLTVTNEFGCFDAVGFTIVVNPLPVFDCPAYGPYFAGDPAIVFAETGVFTFENEVVLGFNPETAGEYLFTYTVTENGCSASCEFSIIVNPVIPPVCPGWVNVQWPPSGTITVGDDYTVYAQIWIDGVTQLAGATPGLSVAIGYSTENTNPDSWTNWVPANYNLDAGNNDEFMANIGAVIPAAGVYYYASRFIYNNCDVVYGGLGGFWDGVNNVSGVLTVEPGVDCLNPATAFAGADAAICADVDYLIADATATNYAAVQWYTLTGDGAFDDETLLNPTYTPGTLDLITGSVELCFTALPSDQLCDPAFDCMTLTFNALPVVTCPDNFAVCLNTPAFDLTGGLPAGGTYSDIHGTTVSFDPATEGVGTHEFTYTYADGNGCSSACTFTITVNPLPTYSYELSATELCYGEEITYTEYFTGTAPWTVEYYWNGELETFTTSENPSITTEVLYETSVYEPVSVTDGNGCTVSVDQPSTITVNPLPTYSYELSATDLCYGEEVTYTEYFTGTAPWTVEYLWNGELETFTTSDNPSITTEVLYETSTYEPVSVTDGNGCSSLVNEPGTITVHPLPTYSYELSATEICYGEEVTYTEYFTGTAPWTVAYYWNGELETFTTSDNPSITSEVLYETSTYEPVSVTDGNGCSSLVNEPSTITVNPLPWIQVTTDLTEVCLNEVITITTVGPEDGDYPFAIVVSVNGTQQPMTLNGPLGVMPFTAPAAGVYDFAIVSITSAKGCVAYPEIEFTLTVNPLPTFTAEVSSTEVCFGQSVTFTDILTGTAPWTVEMLENGVPSSFIVLESPSYFTTIFTETTTQEFVSVTDANGCSNDLNQSITVTVLPLPEIVAQPEDVSELYGGVAVFTVGAQFADSYQWYGPEGMIDGETGTALMIFDITLADAGQYYVAVTNECETINSDVVTLEVLPWTQTISLPSKVNGVSTYLDLIDNVVANNVAPLGTNLQYFSFMRPDQTYVPGGVSFPWTEERGAKLGLKTTWPTSINVVGWPTLGKQVTLPAGWSLVPVWSQGVVSAADVFGPLGSNLVLAMGVTYANAYWPAKNIYTLVNLVPGRAYLVNLVASATLDFDVPIVDKATTDEVLAVNNTTWNNVEMTGTMHAIAITTDAFAQLERRDVIGIFNQNGTIAGMVEIDNLNDNVFVSVYADNSFTNETEGFVNGDMMSFKVYRNGEEIDATASFDASMPNTNIFNEEGISVITGLKLSATSIN